MIESKIRGKNSVTEVTLSTLISDLQAAGASVFPEQSEEGIVFNYNTSTVYLDTSLIDASTFRIWGVGAGGATISVWTGGTGGGGFVADVTNTGTTMTITLGGTQSGWNAYTPGHNNGDTTVLYNGMYATAQGSSGGGALGTIVGSYSGNFPGLTGGPGGQQNQDSQFGGGGGAQDGGQYQGGSGYNYGGGGGSSSGRQSLGSGASGGSSYGSGNYGACANAGYYACTSGGFPGGGDGADIVSGGAAGKGLVVIQWGDGIKPILSHYDSNAVNY
jgi:hypothetical protein